MEVFCGSAVDDSLAPPGIHVLSCFAQYAPQMRPGDWAKQREAAGDAVVNTLARYAPNVPGAIVAREFLGPPDLEDRFGLTGGNIFHGEILPGALFGERPVPGWGGGARTPGRALSVRIGRPPGRRCHGRARPERRDGRARRSRARRTAEGRPAELFNHAASPGRASLLSSSLLAVPHSGVAGLPPCAGGQRNARSRRHRHRSISRSRARTCSCRSTCRPGSTRVRVKICYDQPDAAALRARRPYSVKHTLDLGIYRADAPTASTTKKEFRGWGGSSRPNVLITPETRPTVGFEPGPDPGGEWAAEIGVAAVAGPTEGDPDGGVAWRLEIFTDDDPADADKPWTPAPYDAIAREHERRLVRGRHPRARAALEPERRHDARDLRLRVRAGGPRFHHALRLRHEPSLGRDRPLPAGLSGKLVVRSAEVITYRGHINNHASVPLRGLPHGPDLRAGSGTARSYSCATRSPRAGSSTTSTPRRTPTERRAGGRR